MWVRLTAIALMIAISGPCQAQTNQQAVEPNLKRYADALIELFGRRPPPILHEDWLVLAAVVTRKNPRATLRDVPDMPKNDFPRARFYDELRLLFEEAGAYPARRDDYRRLLACMAMPEQAELVEEYHRSLSRIPLAEQRRKWNAHLADPEARLDFQQNVCRKRFPHDGSQAGALSAALGCMMEQQASTTDLYFHAHWSNTRRVVGYFYRALDFCVVNIRNRDFTREVPFAID